MTKKDKIKQARLLCKQISEIGNEMPERAEEFYDSIYNKSVGIMSSIEDYDNVTDGQINALENMLSGCEKWASR